MEFFSLEPRQGNGTHLDSERDLRARLDALEAAERDAGERYRALALASALVIWGTSPAGEFFDREAGWSEYTGQSPDDAGGFGWLSQVHPDDVAALHGVWSHAARTEQVFETRYRLHHHSGEFRRVQVRGVPVRADGQVVEWIGTFSDIEDSLRAEEALDQKTEALRQSEERLRFAIEASGVGAWHWNVETGEIAWNEGHYLWFGLESQSQLRHIDDLFARVHPDDQEDVRGQIEEALRSDDLCQMSYRIVRPDGKTLWARAMGRVLERGADGRAKWMAGVLADVSAQKEAEDVLRASHDELLAQARSAREEAAELRRALLARLVTAQEEERRRLSRELHDQMGQNLTVIAMSLQSLAGFVEEVTEPLQTENSWLGRELDRRFVALQASIGALNSQADSLARELRPPALDTLGLPAALRQFVADWGQSCGLDAQFGALGFDFDAEGERQAKFASEIEVALYRVVQETLTNVARHAHARSVSVLLQKADGHLAAIIEDDGRGFDPEAGANGRLGIVGMRERLEAVGGSLQIESESGTGTSVFARVPLGAAPSDS